MNLRNAIIRVRKKAVLPVPLYRVAAAHKRAFACPLCGYVGPFRDTVGRWVSKKDSQCPQCGSTERVRIEWLALQEALTQSNRGRAIHFAPEPHLTRLLRPKFAQYETSDFTMPGADHRADLLDLPFDDASYDFLIASHVLEHIKDDLRALSEIRRVLRPGGIAILPVPTMGEHTVEYDEPNPEEAGHVRAPGCDYFERYRPFFTTVVVRSSDDYDPAHQLYSTPRGTSARNPAYAPICYA